MTSTGPIGLFGKIPSQGDFFRVNVGDPAAQALVGWLGEAIEAVYRARLPLPQAPVRFLFRGPETPSALVGVMVAGVDGVGRAFPLCAFVPISARGAATTFPALPAAYRDFLAGAAALLGAAAGLDGATLAARARELPLPAAPAIAAAAEEARGEAARERGPELARRLFGDLPAGAAAGAFGTFEAATRAARGREPARAAVVLDCPVERGVDLWAWLELARRTLAWAAPPPFFWTEGAPGRLVLALGGPTAGLLAHLCDPTKPSSRIWPLRTDKPSAIEGARKGLPPALLRALEADGGVDALIAAAAGR